METKNLEECEVPTLISALTTNRKLINECLEITNGVYADFTSDTSVKMDTDEPTCIMADVIGQTQSLRKLLDLILSIKNQIR